MPLEQLDDDAKGVQVRGHYSLVLYCIVLYVLCCIVGWPARAACGTHAWRGVARTRT